MRKYQSFERLHWPHQVSFDPGERPNFV